MRNDEPAPNHPDCLGVECAGYRGRLIRGTMCDRHYKAWTTATPKDQRPKARVVRTGCQVTGCDVQLIQGRGWCAKHYARWKNHGSPTWEPPAPLSECTVDDCGREHYATGYCVTHYYRVKTHGDPHKGARVVRSGVCEAPDCSKPSPGMQFCPMHRERLKRNGTFERVPRSDRHKHSMGYEIVKRKHHPLANRQGWVYEHRAVLFDAIGPGWHPCHRCGMQVSWELTYPENLDALVVDHLDEDRSNNDPANLAPACSVCNFQRSSRWVKQRRGKAA